MNGTSRVPFKKVIEKVWVVVDLSEFFAVIETCRFIAADVSVNIFPLAFQDSFAASFRNLKCCIVQSNRVCMALNTPNSIDFFLN